jgi:hypothetical protein
MTVRFLGRRLLGISIYASQDQRVHGKVSHHHDQAELRVSQNTQHLHRSPLMSGSWSAVARGAAAKGLEGAQGGAVLARKSRRHYGTSCTQTFNRRKHKPYEAYRDPYDGEKRADNQMSWLIAKGQDLQASNATHATEDMSTDFWPQESRRTEWELLACDLDIAPRSSNDPVCVHPFIRH